MRQRPLKRTRFKKALPALFCAGIAVLLPLLTGCKRETPTVTEPTTAVTTTENAAQTFARQRVEDSIQTALELVKKNPVGGWFSTVSYEYQQDNAAYAELNDDQQALYDEMLPKVKDLTPFTYTAKDRSYAVLDNVLMAASALCQDHPEYENYFDIEEVVEGDRTTALRACYFLPYDATGAAADTKQIKEEIQIFEEECNLIVSAIPKNFSTYDKYRYLAAVISLRTTYDNDSAGGKPSATAYGAIEGGASICQGYASGFEYLCRKANLWCTQVSGVSQDTAHAWNLVKLESGTYHIDLTWADADGNTPLDPAWQSYFMLTQEEILLDHQMDDGTEATGKNQPQTAGQ